MEDSLAHSPKEGYGWDQAHSLSDHLNSVGSLVENILHKTPLVQIGKHIGDNHDFGKFRYNFQRYLKGEFFENAEKSHKYAGALYIQNNASTLIEGFDDLDKMSQDALIFIFAFPISGHHSGLNYQNVKEIFVLKKGPKFNAATTEYEEASKNCNYDFFLLKKEEYVPWLNKLKRSKHKHLFLEMSIRMVYSALVDADCLDTQGFYSPSAITNREAYKMKQESIDILLDKLLAYVDKLQKKGKKGIKKINELRALLFDMGLEKGQKSKSKMFSLTAPTGFGKTLMGMAFCLSYCKANNLDGVIYVAPFCSITTQTASIFREIFGEINVLEHTSQWDGSEEDIQVLKKLNISRPEEKKEYRTRLLSDNWDCNIIVTTAVQILESLHKNKPAKSRKIHNLQNKVIFFDESQQLPVKFIQTTLDTLTELSENYNTTVVFSTATQPDFNILNSKNQIVNSLILEEIVDNVGVFFAAMDRVDFKVLGNLIASNHWRNNSDDIYAKIMEYSQVLIITDLKRDAIEIANYVNADYCLTTLLTSADRAKQIEEIKTRIGNGEKIIVVSTQLIEAGVDISFPIVFRSFAGLDSITQAAGRCNRSGEFNDKGIVYIFPAGENLIHLHEINRKANISRGILSQSNWDVNKVLKDYNTFANFYQKVYRDLPRKDKEIAKHRTVFNFEEIASLYRIIPDAQVPILIMSDKTKQLRDKIDKGWSLNRTDIIKLRNHSVNVFPKVIEKLSPQLREVEINESMPYFILEEAFLSLYNKKTGLKIEDFGTDIIEALIV